MLKAYLATCGGTAMQMPRSGRVTILHGAVGSGKTSLAHLLASGKPLTRTATTVGCNTFVRVRHGEQTAGCFEYAC